MSKFRFFIVLLTAWVTLASFPASGAPITFGKLTTDAADGTNLIKDSLNNLEWLRWDVLKDYTYAETLAAIAPGGAYDGWEIAHNTEAQWFINALLDPSAHNCTTSNDTRCSTLVVPDGTFGENFNSNVDYAWFLSDNGTGEEAGLISLAIGGTLKNNEGMSIAQTDLFSHSGSNRETPVPWLLYRTAPVLSIVIPKGTPQECVNAGSSTINMEAWVTLPNGDTIDTVSWKLDGSPVNVFGEFVNILVPLGTHTVEATVTTILLLSATDSTTISVEDTIVPVISTGFINAKTGTVITSIKSRDKAIPSYSISDVCDPAPTVVSATAGVPAENVDTVSAKASRKDSSVNVSIKSNANKIELTVAAEDASGNMSSDKATLTIIP